MPPIIMDNYLFFIFFLFGLFVVVTRVYVLLMMRASVCLYSRYDQKGRGLQNQTLIDTWSARGAANIKWKTLSDVKSEWLGHDVKVQSTQTYSLLQFSKFTCC